MEFKIERESLKEALGKIQNVVEKKSTKPILSNTLLEVGENNLCLSGTDLEVGIQINLNVETKKPGKIAVPAKSLHDIVRELKAAQIHFKQNESGWLQILSGKSKFKVAGLPAEEFPTMPELPTQGKINVDAPIFKDMIDKTLMAVSTDETKYNLGGLYLESKGEKKLRLVATDGHRLSLDEREMTQAIHLEKPVLLPRKGVLELQKMISEEDGVLPMFLEGRNVVVQKGELTLFIRLIEGEFPKYEQVIPKNNDKEVIISKEQFNGALRRVSLLAQDHNRGVKFKLSSGSLELMCSNPDLGEAKEELECEYSGEHIEVGFNYRYFLDVLNILPDEKVHLWLKDEVSPGLIKSEVDPGFVSLVMPMRL